MHPWVSISYPERPILHKKPSPKLGLPMGKLKWDELPMGSPWVHLATHIEPMGRMGKHGFMGWVIMTKVWL